MLLKNMITIFDLCPKHVFPMKTVFRKCFLINFAMSPSNLQSVLPYPIKPKINKNTGEAFLSVVIADMDKMRPSFLPYSMGITYNQVVYRAVINIDNYEEGVYFVRSDADNRLMCLFGNLGSFFKFNFANIKYEHINLKNQNECFDKYMFQKNGNINISVIPENKKSLYKAKINLLADLNSTSKTIMNPESAFANIDDAKSFLTDLYCAYAIHPLTKNITKVNIIRSPWNIRVFHKYKCNFEFMNKNYGPFKEDTRLDSVFYVEDLYYHWYTLQQFKI